ncbi:MAG: hypothetical protein WCF86_04405, partial [Pseudolabrys sp.]
GPDGAPGEAERENYRANCTQELFHEVTPIRPKAAIARRIAPKSAIAYLCASSALLHTQSGHGPLPVH